MLVMLGFFFSHNPQFYLCLDAFLPCWVSLFSLSPSLPLPTLGLFLAESALFFFLRIIWQTDFPKLIWLIPLTNHNRFFWPLRGVNAELQGFFHAICFCSHEPPEVTTPSITTDCTFHSFLDKNSPFMIKSLWLLPVLRFAAWKQMATWKIELEDCRKHLSSLRLSVK